VVNGSNYRCLQCERPRIPTVGTLDLVMNPLMCLTTDLMVVSINVIISERVAKPIGELVVECGAVDPRTGPGYHRTVSYR